MANGSNCPTWHLPAKDLRLEVHRKNREPLFLSIIDCLLHPAFWNFCFSRYWLFCYRSKRMENSCSKLWNAFYTQFFLIAISVCQMSQFVSVMWLSPGIATRPRDEFFDLIPGKQGSGVYCYAALDPESGFLFFAISSLCFLLAGETKEIKTFVTLCAICSALMNLTIYYFGFMVFGLGFRVSRLVVFLSWFVRLFVWRSAFVM